MSLSLTSTSLKEIICSAWTSFFSPLIQAIPEFSKLTKSEFLSSTSEKQVLQIASHLISFSSRECGRRFAETKGKDVGSIFVDLVTHMTEQSMSFIADKSARANVDFFMCQLVMASLKPVRTHVISYYARLKSQYNYDLISQLQECTTEDEMIEQLKNLNVLLRFALESMRGIFGTAAFFECAEGVLTATQNKQLRGLYVNVLLKLISNDISNKHSLLEKLYGFRADSQEYFAQLTEDSSYVQKFFEEIQSIGSTKKQLNPSEETTADELDANDIELIQLRRKQIKSNNNDLAAAAVTTATPTHEIIEVDAIADIRQALLEHSMVVVDGAAGAGKTTIIHWLAKQTNSSMISLFVDATADLKSLVGSYVCTQNVGQFEWKNGPLITAMQQGMWLVLENFAEATEEVIDAIVKCAQEGQYYIPTQAKTVIAHYRFKIIGIGNLGQKYETKKQLLMNRCSKGGYLTIADMSENTLKEILRSRFSSVISTQSDLIERVFSIVKYLRFDKVISRQYREFRELISSSKLLRVFKRIAFHVSTVGSHGNSAEGTKELRRRVFLDFMDVAVLALKEAEKDSKLILEIMKAFEINKEEFAMLITKYHPEIEVAPKAVRIGRLGVIQRTFFGSAALSQAQLEADATKTQSAGGVVYNGYSSRLIERIASCLYFDEPCLLVGDTGCGKTTMAQHVAAQFRKNLHIYNMNQGSDAIDLIGGFKPIDVRIIVRKLLGKYVKKFGEIANADANKPFFDSLFKLEENRSYPLLLKTMLSSFDGILKRVAKKISTTMVDQPQLAARLNEKWEKMHKKVKQLYANRDKIESNLAFHFVEGNLIKAIKQGDWVLIDEINLANNEVLQKLLPIIEGRSILLYERGDISELTRHPQFRVLGCMNRGNDVGKKELPANVRAKFTEIYVHDISEREDISNLVRKKLGTLVSADVAGQIVDLFMNIKKATETNELCDGYNKKSHVSLRNLARSLNYIRNSISVYPVERAVYDGLYLGFGTALSIQSQEIFEKQLEKLLGISPSKYYTQMLSSIPLHVDHRTEIVLYGFKLARGSQPVKRAEECEFFVTDTFKKYIIDLLRAIANTDLPVLLEGPTSAGKTSMVKYIAELAGYKCVRVNNHHHTEIEEYIGTYLPDSKGRLVFHEGVLIEAMKRGDWLILDELNLARSEILESLNRLLDDNKELFVNETQSYIKPHANFRIFATQNPTTYGGRKELSKAFKNRFVQIYFDEIAEKDLEAILLKRCSPRLSQPHCKKLIAVLKDLKVFRQRNNFFLGKDGVITVRDLIKWGNRSIESVEDLAIEGYCLLAERLRTYEERAFISKVIEKHCKVKLDSPEYYERFSRDVLAPMMRAKAEEVPFYLQLNHGFKRMACLVLKALQNAEPVLLIGETGCGKTTLAELVAYLRESKLYSINCHQYTESSDFLGSLRPVRNKEKSSQKLEAFLDGIFRSSEQVKKQQDDLRRELFDQMIAVHERVARFVKHLQREDIAKDLEALLVEYETMFEWQDGPLVESMENGGVFLIDEISLAEDSVLERLNSVLESDRFLLLPEKSKSEQVFAHPKFVIISTMNPGGDFGKRELSPALRNRFTEIWVEPLTTKSLLSTAEGKSDVIEMIDTFLTKKRVYESAQTRATISRCLYEFLVFYNIRFCEKHNLDKKNLTMRDIVALMAFISQCRGNCSVRDLYAHALALVIVEPIGFMPNSPAEKTQMRLEIESFIQDQLETMLIDEHEDESNIDKVRKTSVIEIELSLLLDESHPLTSWRVGAFTIPFNPAAAIHIPSVPAAAASINYSVGSTRTQNSLEKIIRAMQLDKAILLEGLPGVGKSSMVEYIALKTKNELARISLSEQTDIVDLLGSDLPAPAENSTEQDDAQNKSGSSSMKFKWFDGVLLDALKKGTWILLEELNLASQSVLEGLNAILDHRGTVFIPEINQSFTKHPNFRVFATQNPMSLGGGRKGLPASFLNRFSKIFIEEYSHDEFEYILRDVFASDFPANAEIFDGMMRIARECASNYSSKLRIGSQNPRNKPNLRDFLRFAEIALHSSIHIAFEIVFAQFFAPKTPLSIFFSQETSEAITTTTTTTTPIIDEVQLSNTLNHRIPLNYGYFDAQNERVILLNSQRKPLTYLQLLIERCHRHCAAYIIRGRAGSGKSNLVRILSELNNNKRIVTFTLNSTTDSSELIGGYDQVDHTRKIAQTITKLVQTITGVLQQEQQHISLTRSQSIALLKFLEASKQFSNDRNTITTNNTNLIKATKTFIQECLSLLESILETNPIESLNHSIRNIQRDFNEIKRTSNDETNAATGAGAATTNQQSSSSSSSFEWFDSVIIEAVQRGDWLVLDGIRRANQAVFARLNALMERDLQGRRRIVITECHQRGDSTNASSSSLDYITIHEDFRLFLLIESDSESGCLDSSLNESIRNKCVEIAVDTFDAKALSSDLKSLTELTLSPSQQQQQQQQLQINSADNNTSTPSLVDTISHRILAWIESLPSNLRYFDIGLFTRFLHVFSSKFTAAQHSQTIPMSQETLDRLIVEALEVTYMLSNARHPSQTYLEQHLLSKRVVNSQLTALMSQWTDAHKAAFMEQLDGINSTCVWTNSLNFTEFPLNRELHRYRGIASAVFSKLAQQESATTISTRDNVIIVPISEQLRDFKLAENLSGIMTAQNFASHVNLFVARLSKAELHAISSKSMSTHALFDALNNAFETIRTTRKVFAASIEFRRARESLLAAFAEAIQILSAHIESLQVISTNSTESSSQEALLQLQHATQIIQRAMLQSIKKLDQLPKIYKLIVEKIVQAISVILQRKNTNNLQSLMSSSSSQNSLNDNLFVVLWRASAFFDRMPRRAHVFEARQKVSYLLQIHGNSRNISNNNAQNSISIIELKKRFDLMYFLENPKTRLTGIEVLALIYSGGSSSNTNVTSNSKQKNTQSSSQISHAEEVEQDRIDRETSERIFAAFEGQVTSILSTNHEDYCQQLSLELGGSEKPEQNTAEQSNKEDTNADDATTEKQTGQIDGSKFEIRIVDSQTTGDDVIHRIPIILSDASLRYYELSALAEQNHTVSFASAFTNRAFVSMREFCVFEAVKAFAVTAMIRGGGGFNRSSMKSNDVTNNKKQPSQQQGEPHVQHRIVEKLKLNVVEHMDRPDFYSMRVFALLKDGKNSSIDDLVEIFYLARMKSRNVDHLIMHECAREIKSVKIKHLPLLNREVDLLRSSINMGMHLSETELFDESNSNESDHDATAAATTTAQLPLESIRIFVLAYLWLLRVFERIVFGATNNTMNAQSSNNEQCDESNNNEVFGNIFNWIKSREISEILAFQESILLARRPVVKSATMHAFVEQLCIKVNAELKEMITSNELLRIGGLFLRLFSIRSTYFSFTNNNHADGTTVTAAASTQHRDCLSELVKEDYELQFAETAFEDRWNDYVSLCVIEQALAGNVDDSQVRHVKERTELEQLAMELRTMKSRIIYRGGSSGSSSNDNNINAFSEFFAENIPFVEKIEGYFERISHRESIIREQQQQSQTTPCTTQLTDDQSALNDREMREAIKHIDNWLNISFEKYYETFADFLIPLHFALILLKEYYSHSSVQYRIFKNNNQLKNLNASEDNSIIIQTQIDTYPSRVRLICGSSSARLQQLSAIVRNQPNAYNLLHCDAILKHIRLSQLLSRDSKGLRDLFACILTSAHSNLTLSETYDKLVEDDTTKYIKAQRQFEKMIVDEYQKDTIDAYKHKERAEIHAMFSSFAKDYSHFLQLDLSISEKLDASKQVLTDKFTQLAQSEADQDAIVNKTFEELSNSEVDIVRARSTAVILEILDIAEQQRISAAIPIKSILLTSSTQIKTTNTNLTSLNEANHEQPIDEKAKKKEDDFHNIGAWKDFSFAHRLIYLKLWLMRTSHQSSSSTQQEYQELTSTSAPFDDRILDMLEYSSAFGQIIRENLFESCLPPPPQQSPDDQNNNKSNQNKAKKNSTSNRKRKYVVQQLDTSQTQFNVYEDVIPSENVKVMQPLMAILSAARRLLYEEEVFAGNENLMNLAMICDFVLELPALTTPLNQIITGIQVIAEKVEEWNASTPRMYAFTEEIKPIVALLLYWRKLERKCWKFMLAKKDREIESLDVVMFLRVRSLLQEPETMCDAGAQMKIIESYMRGSVMGTFALRLKALYFLGHCDTAMQPPAIEASVTRSLQASYAYYSQFFNTYSSQILTNRNEHEKECADYVSLAGWDSKQYLTLKATIEKFQTKVYRIIKRYRDFLQEPIEKHIFEASRVTAIFADSFEAFHIKFYSQFVSELVKLTPIVLNSTNNKHKQHPQIAQQCAKILSTQSLSIPLGSIPESSSSIRHMESPNTAADETSVWSYKEEMIAHVFERISDLQNTEEVTRNMKFKAVLDFFKYLTYLGFKAYASLPPISPALIYETHPTNPMQVENNNNNNTISFMSFESDMQANLAHDFTYMDLTASTILDMLLTLRNNGAYHEDISREYIRRGTALLQQYFMFIARLRNDLSAAFTNSQELLCAMKSISIVASEQYQQAATIITSPSKHESIYSVDQDLQDIGVAVQSFILSVANMREEIREIGEKEPEGICEHAARIEAISDQLFNPKRNVVLSTNRISSVLNALIDMHACLRKIIAAAPTTDTKYNRDVQVIVKARVREAATTISKIIQKLQDTLINQSKVSVVDDRMQLEGEAEEVAQQDQFIESENIVVKDLQLFTQSIVKCMQEYKNNLRSVIEEDEDENDGEEQIEAEREEIVGNNTSAEQSNNRQSSKGQQETEKYKKTGNELNFIANEEAVLAKFTKLLSKFWSKFQSEHLTEVIRGVRANRFTRVSAMFDVLHAYLSSCLVYFTKSLRTQSKFVRLLGIVLTNLVYKGFCQPKTDADGNPLDGEPQDSGKIDYKEGTGIGEGIGMENVSKEIEFEEQLLGNKGDEEEEENAANQDGKEEKKEEKDDFFKMEQDFNGTTSKQDDLDDNQRDQADKDADEVFSQVSEEELDFKMWEGDDNEDAKENAEDKEPNRKKDDIQFQGSGKASGEENDRAKEQEKEKKDTRNIDKFEQIDVPEHPESEQPLINELKNPIEDENDTGMKDEDDDDRKGKNRKGNEDEDDDEEEGEDADGTVDKTADVMESKKSEQEQLDQNAMEVEEEEIPEKKVPTDSVEEQPLPVYSEDKDKNNDDVNAEEEDAEVPNLNNPPPLPNQQQANDDSDSDKEEPEKSKEKKKQQPKKKEQKQTLGRKFGVEGDDDLIEIEDNGDDNDEDKKEHEKQQQPSNGEDSRQDRIEHLDSLDDPSLNRNPPPAKRINDDSDDDDEDNSNKFSLDFLRDMIENTRVNEKDLTNFFRDLNVVASKEAAERILDANERNALSNKNNSNNNPLDKEQMENIEFEVVNTKNFDIEELKNMIATNMNAPEMHSASAAVPQDMQMEHEHNEDNMMNNQPPQQQPKQAPKQPSLPNQPEHDAKLKEEIKNRQKQQQLKKNSNNNANTTQDAKKPSEIDFLEEKRRAEEKARQIAERNKRLRRNRLAENGIDIESEDSEDDKVNSKEQYDDPLNPFDRNAHLKKDRSAVVADSEMDLEDEESDDGSSSESDELKAGESAQMSAAEKRAAMLALIQQSKLLHASSSDFSGSNGGVPKGQHLWQRIESEVRSLSSVLCEELKAILEPTVIAAFKGDYKSGKRLNMKKIIPYIASNFRKDKIWLRRSDPSKRTYQILLAIDDSLSMSQQNVGHFALQAMMVLALALTKLEVGQVAIGAVKNGLALLHDFATPLTPAESPYILSQFDFTHAQANSSDLDLVKFMRETIDLMGEARKNGTRDTQQICFIMSDGRFNKKLVKPLVVEAEQKQILFVFIVLDKQEEKESILNVKSTNQKYVNGKLQIEMKLYLEDFPFKNYIVVKDVQELSRVLVDILRQYYEMSADR